MKRLPSEFLDTMKKGEKKPMKEPLTADYSAISQMDEKEFEQWLFEYETRSNKTYAKDFVKGITQDQWKILRHYLNVEGFKKQLLKEIDKTK